MKTYEQWKRSPGYFADYSDYVKWVKYLALNAIR
jgi:hypothetical protein